MSKPVGDPSATQGPQPENLAWMRQHHDDGSMLFSGPTKEGVGIWVMKAASREDVQAKLATNPFVKAGYRDVSEIYEWNVVQALGVGFPAAR
jgi:uncharacterized protein YciI